MHSESLQSLCSASLSQGASEVGDHNAWTAKIGLNGQNSSHWDVQKNCGLLIDEPDPSSEVFQFRLIRGSVAQRWNSENVLKNCLLPSNSLAGRQSGALGLVESISNLHRQKDIAINPRMCEVVITGTGTASDGFLCIRIQICLLFFLENSKYSKMSLKIGACETL